MKFNAILKILLAVGLMYEAANAVSKKKGVPPCQWIGFNLDPSMNYKIIVRYNTCKTGIIQDTVPFGPNTDYPIKPDPFQAKSQSWLTIYEVENGTQKGNILLRTYVVSKPAGNIFTCYSNKGKPQCVKVQ